MIDSTAYSLRLPDPVAPMLERTLSGHDLDEALDAWLADDRSNESFAHVYGWTDDEEASQ